jgi:hypothetical protein
MTEDKQLEKREKKIFPLSFNFGFWDLLLSAEYGKKDI